jgi:hypothetical protein
MKTKAPFPPPLFPRKGVTLVRGLRPLRFVDSLPPWGGPAEAA